MVSSARQGWIQNFRILDRGSRYIAINYSDPFGLCPWCIGAGAAPSLGRLDDAYDNALAELVIGLFKTEVIHRRGPGRGFEDVEYATLEWVAWFNTQRLLAPPG